MNRTPNTELERPSVIIERSRGLSSLGLRSLWESRELIYFLVWRDIKVRYKQTALGISWVILQPFFTTIVFTLFFDRMVKVGSDGLPYPLFAFAGLLPWTFFAQGLGRCSNSLVGAAGLLKKVYFPRLVIPIAAALGGVLDLAVGLVALFAMMAWYGVPVGAALFALPAVFALALACVLGVGLWLSALNVQYRDVGHIAPYFIQIWMFLTPVIYPASRVVEALETRGMPGWLFGLNPMAGAVDGFRWSVFGAAPQAGVLAAGAAVALLLVVTGAVYFKRMERTFADVV